MSSVTSRDIALTNAEFSKVLGPLDRENCRNYEILNKLYTYYSEPGRIDKILPYLEPRHRNNKPFSLRDFETFNVHIAPWTNASFKRKVPVIGTCGREYTTEIFIVYQKYKAQLKSYNKETFDPFKRGVPFEFFYTYVNPETGESETESFFTAICQLNYFLWADTTGIIDYITTNYDRIVASINSLDALKKITNREKFKELILEKQRLSHYFATKSLPAPNELIPV
jgi:hypothetical protein